MKKKLKFLVLASLLFASTNVKGQCPQATNNFADHNAPTSTSFVNTTTCHYGGEYANIFNCIAGAVYQYTTCGDTDFDTQLTVRDGFGGAVLAYNDDDCGLQSTVTWTQPSNGTAVISIHEFNCVGNSGPCMTLQARRISVPSGPPNDNCASASAISIGGTASGNTADPSATSVNLTCGTPDGTGAELWYTFTGNGSQLSLETTVASYDTKLWLYDGCNFATDCIAGNDDGGVGTLSRIDFCSVNGQTYRVAVGGFGSNEGTFTLTLTDVDDNPAISCTGNQSISAGVNCQYVHSGTSWDATATDDCGISSITYSLSGATSGSGSSLNGVTFELGLTTVAWTVTDVAGNTDVCSFTVTVDPIIPSGVSAGPDVTICLGESTNLTGTATSPPVTLSGSTTFNYSESGFDTDDFIIGDLSISGLPTGAVVTSITFDAIIDSEAECQSSWYDWDLYVGGVFIDFGCTTFGYVYNGLNGQLANGSQIWLQGHDLDGISDFISSIDFDLTINYDYPSVHPITYAWTPTTGLDDPSIANPTATPSVTTTYTLTTNIYGCIDVTDQVEVTVRDASSLVVLVNDATVSAAVEQCTEPDGWTYYATAANPDDYVFAIKKNGNAFTADVTITDVPSTGTAPIESLGGQPNVRGTWLISRYWNVEIAGGSIVTPVDIRFFIDDMERTEALAAANAFAAANPWPSVPVSVTPLTWFKTEGAPFNPATDLVNGNFTFTPTYLSSNATGTKNGVTYYDLTGIVSFSGGTGGFSVNDNASPLPVELLSFEAKAINNEYIQLDWATATEINNAGFELLRSTDGVNFEMIAWIDGYGNSNQVNNYSYDDWDVLKGKMYYYRIKQVDYDGQYEYFHIESAKLDGSTGFSIGELIPNPSLEGEVVKVNVSVDTQQDIQIAVYNSIGKQVAYYAENLNPGSNQIMLDLKNLSSGTYFVSFEGSFGRETKNLVIIE